MKNYNLLKLYCSYTIIALFSVFIFLDLVSVTQGYLEIRYDLYSVPSGLKPETYYYIAKYKKIPFDQIEKKRQQHIEDDKKHRFQKLKNDILIFNLPSLFFSSIIMLINIFIVVREKRKINE